MTEKKVTYQMFHAKVLNLRKIFDKLNGLIDTEKFRKELDLILEESENIYTIDDVMGERENKTLSISFLNEKLDYLTGMLNKELTPYYEIHLLTAFLNKESENISQDKLNCLTEKAIDLLTILRKVDTYNKEDLTKLCKMAYRSIYKVLLIEEVYGKSDLLDFILSSNNEVDKEMIGDFIIEDSNELSELDILNNELNELHSNGIGYDHVDKDILRKIAYIKYTEEFERFSSERKSATSEVLGNIDEATKEKERLERIINESNRNISRCKIRLDFVRLKLLPFVLVPIMGIASGWHFIGNSLRENKVTTRTYNLATHQVISETFAYSDDDVPTTFKVTEYSPWEEKSDNDGYYRIVEEYSYNEDEYEEGINKENNLTARSVESKVELSKDDETEKHTTLVTEETQDEDDYKISGKSRAAGASMGLIIGGVLDLLIFLGYDINDVLDNYDVEKNNLKRRIRLEKETKEDTIKRLSSLKEKLINLDKEYKEKEEKYGTIEQEEIIVPVKVLRR